MKKILVATYYFVAFYLIGGLYVLLENTADIGAAIALLLLAAVLLSPAAIEYWLNCRAQRRFERGE